MQKMITSTYKARKASSVGSTAVNALLIIFIHVTVLFIYVFFIS